MPWDNQSSSQSRSGGQAPGGGFTGDRGSEGGNSNSRGSGDNLGMMTGNTWHGTTAFGDAGGSVRGYGTRQSDGSYAGLSDTFGNPLGAAAPAQPTPPPRSNVPRSNVPRPPPVGVVPPPAIPPRVPRPNVPRPYVNIPPSVFPTPVNSLIGPRIGAPRLMSGAVGLSPYNTANFHAPSNYSYYNNPTLGTPTTTGGLGDYAGPPQPRGDWGAMDGGWN